MPRTAYPGTGGLDCACLAYRPNIRCIIFSRFPPAAGPSQGSTEQGHDDFETEGRDSFYHKNLYSWSSGQDTVQ